MLFYTLISTLLLTLIIVVRNFYLYEKFENGFYSSDYENYSVWITKDYQKIRDILNDTQKISFRYFLIYDYSCKKYYVLITKITLPLIKTKLPIFYSTDLKNFIKPYGSWENLTKELHVNGLKVSITGKEYATIHAKINKYLQD